jgi:ring-1,2-phenylacetyl-CoA epoxidase subunit PaaD
VTAAPTAVPRAAALAAAEPAAGADAGKAAMRIAAAWAALAEVPDPEVPVLSVVDLGIVRELSVAPDAVLDVVLTPTYSGCPATEVIAASVQEALETAGLGPVRLQQRLAPAWTTDWMSAAGREKLRAYGIAPPQACAAAAAAAEGAVPGLVARIRIQPRAVACPRCGSERTERLAAFGSTACKALHRCLACGEPFDHFKPI